MTTHTYASLSKMSKAELLFIAGGLCSSRDAKPEIIQAILARQSDK